jgi:hypothetical protein
MLRHNDVNTIFIKELRRKQSALSGQRSALSEIPTLSVLWEGREFLSSFIFQAAAKTAPILLVA